MKVLFICLGNVARSQMAEALYNKLTNSSDATSAGCLDYTPEKYVNPIPEVVEVMKEEGVDVSKKKVKFVNKGMVDAADKVVVFCKKGETPDFVRNSEKTEFIPIEDPYEESMDVYKQTRDLIKEKVKGLIEKEAGE